MKALFKPWQQTFFLSSNVRVVCVSGLTQLLLENILEIQIEFIRDPMVKHFFLYIIIILVSRGKANLT